MNLWAPWSLRSLVSDLRSGRTTAADALERSRVRVSETEPTVRAWVEYDPARPALAAGPLCGAPFGVKDIIDLRGFPTRCGSALRAHAAPAEHDAPIVDAWISAGAVPLGKTVTTEFAFFSPGPTGNPAAPGHTPGGSSSGSAAAVAAGQVPLALGSQTAGSVTRPASFCGVASLVMTRGSFSGAGVVGLSPSCDSHGVFAATASDLALAWSALTETPDVGDAAGVPPRVLLWTAEQLGVVDEEMAAALAAAAEHMAAAGAIVDTFPLEGLVAELTAAHPVVMAHEAARERRAELASANQLSEPFAALLRTGASITDGDYDAALAFIRGCTDRVVDALSSYDAILGPGAPGAAPAGVTATGDPVLSRAWQAMGLPSIGVPGLRNSQGLPLGLQLVGRAGAEADALRAACWVERHL